MTTKRRTRAGSIKWLQELFEELNKEFYDGRLPRIQFEWTTLPGTIIARVRWRRHRGNLFKPYVMQFSRILKHRALQKQVGMSMLHEMAHMKLGVEVDCKEWDGEHDKEMFRLAAAGAFRYFW